MNFPNDPIADKVEVELRALRVKGVALELGKQYNRVFEAFYRLHQELSTAQDEAARLASEVSALREEVAEGKGGGWVSKKPELDHPCLLLTAKFLTGYISKGFWDYQLYEIAKIESDEGWYWGILQEGEEWGDIADLVADKYKVVPLDTSNAPKP